MGKMSSLLWSKEDVNFNNDDLGELNCWAEQHAAVCLHMKKIIEGEQVMTYIMEYCPAKGIYDHGCACRCGASYFVGRGRGGKKYGL